MRLRPTLVPAGAALLGGVFLAVALWLLLSDAPDRELARGSRLPVATATTLRWRTAGDVVLLEGTLAASNRPIFRDFVAYDREEFLGEETSGPDKGRERWSLIERVTPPLVLETADGPLALGGTRYELRHAPQRWRSSARDAVLFGPKGERARGFIAGDVVTVEASVQEPAPGGAGSNLPPLQTLVLFGGDRAAYLRDLQDGILVVKILGWVFLGVGAFLILLGGFLLRRFARRPSRARR